jgi:hypothetical protein
VVKPFVVNASMSAPVEEFTYPPLATVQNADPLPDTSAGKLLEFVLPVRVEL